MGGERIAGTAKCLANACFVLFHKLRGKAFY
jgi:hypothetical protein